jgi:hypothetical protein
MKIKIKDKSTHEIDVGTPVKFLNLDGETCKGTVNWWFDETHIDVRVDMRGKPEDGVVTGIYAEEIISVQEESDEV